MKNIGKFIFVFALGIIFFNSITSCNINNYYTDPDKCYKEAIVKPVDVIIVPGYPHTKDNWEIATKLRVYWALYLYEKGIAKNIIFSGSAVYSPYIESKIMAMYAEKLGIPKEHIFIETQAEHSTENMYYSYLIAKEKGFKSIALATDVVQSSFMKSLSGKLELDSIRYIPIVFDTLQVMSKIDPIIDQDQAFVPNFIPITERENIFQRLKGTRGGKVKRLIKKSSFKRNE